MYTENYGRLQMFTGQLYCIQGFRSGITTAASRYDTTLQGYGSVLGEGPMIIHV